MKKYKHSSYNYVSIVELNKDEIEKIDFAACKEPRETLGSFYNRQKEKPEVLINAGFFGMSGGHPCFIHIDEGVTRANDMNYKVGMGTSKSDKSKLLFGKVDDGTSWNDFISAYPVLLDGNGPITKFTMGSEINYKATRSCLAMNNDKIFVVHIGKPGMNFSTMSKMLYAMGATHAINLDGGGSARLMVEGKVYGTPTENRSVDNVLAIYLKTTPADEDVIPSTSDTAYISYTVVKGDSWWKIAQNHLGDGNKYKELMLFNGITTTSLRVGQVIKIPAKEYKYVVKSGDSWWKIAANEMGSGLKYKELAKYNGKTTTSALHPGDVLKIPV